LFYSVEAFRLRFPALKVTGEPVKKRI